MRKWGNEDGYALLIVLFIIVLVLTVSAVFMRGSLGNAMHEHQVDESHLTVMAAEAGVDYTKQLLGNEYFERKQELDKLANEMILKTPKNEKVNYEEIHKKIKEKLKDYLKTRIGQEKYNVDYVVFTNPYHYKLINPYFSNSENSREIIFSGTIEGKKDGKGLKNITKRVTFKQSFLIPDYSGTSNPDGSGSPSSLNMHKLYPDGVSASGCVNKNGEVLSLPNPCVGLQNGGYKDIQNLTIYFPNGYNSPNGNFNVNNSKLYSKGNLNIDIFNNLMGSHLYVDGSFNVKNMNNMTNSSLYINGSAGITNNVQNMDNSSIVIRGSAHLNGHLTIKNNSMVCVTGSLQIDKQLKIEQGSKLVHWGALVAHGGKNITGEVIQVYSENEVWEKCKLENSNPVLWAKPSIVDVSYE